MSSSLAPECNEVKERYDSCFLKWYSEKYLRGKGQKDECAALFNDYKHCLTVSFPTLTSRIISDDPKGALKERGIDKMLEEAREDHKDSDAVHMRRTCKFIAEQN
ncbi:distribution and morphology 35 [Hyphodiscus hymeniophilus]|uniref:Distribution and morphology 35 n=1 Tax=Hyphodiscus hymeniophilus TaxID=353542 RepID=A0A9P6VFU3_9HELO|nr:distribution and morphology 35 [Hyphodiscus hymeniophilus]